MISRDIYLCQVRYAAAPKSKLRVAERNQGTGAGVISPRSLRLALSQACAEGRFGLSPTGTV